MLLRDVEPGDVAAYVRMRCNPVMMAELGGPQAREGIEAKVLHDVVEAEADTAWILMIQPDEDAPATVAGSVVLWSHAEDSVAFSEIGWMVLPEFQHRGLAKEAVRLVHERARDDGRWGLVHAYPGATNGPSNGICRSLGFTLLGQEEILAMNDQPMTANHWVFDPTADLSSTARGQGRGPWGRERS